ncbi:MAG: Rieske 2Fe-2S domain-containing protein [Sneathiella sp.]
MSGGYVRVASQEELTLKKRLVVKTEGKQIALFKSEDEILACNNRCPHEGYPLSEGSLSSDCILTCNWHNWKFDLKGGQTLVGGDEVRLYPVRISGDDILLDLTDPPKERSIEKALGNLKDSFRRQEYDRMAREIARLEKVGGDPLEAIRQAIHWTYDRFEYGMTHAYAATADWLSLRNKPGLSGTDRLVPLVESVGHMSWDSLREPAYPFNDDRLPFDRDQFEQALEAENENKAIALLNGALNDAVDLQDLFRSLARYALAHYAGFGHSAIYTYKIEQLIRHLGPSVQAPLLKALTRNLIYSTREELLPEFRRYGDTLAAWGNTSTTPTEPLSLEGASVNQALAKTSVYASLDPEAIYQTLLLQLARNMLFFDISLMDKWDKSVSQNINWLDYSHGLTFANAIHHLCDRDPALWPQALLQMACFIGRNSAYSDFSQDMSDWQIEDPGGFFEQAEERLLDHANPEFIVSAHLVKLTTAARTEANRSSENAPAICAAINRFLNAPFKRKHTRRTAQQSLDFVAREG